jgi:uncharacterized protein (DUF302 family)
LQKYAHPNADEKGIAMASETTIELRVNRHVLYTERWFGDVLDDLLAGISQPDIGKLIGEFWASTTYEEYTAKVEQALGSAGLIRFMRVDLHGALTLDPDAPDHNGRSLVRLIVGNPLAMGEMARTVADAASYAPVTILLEELADGRTRIAYDTVASAIASYNDAAASQVAEQLDASTLALLREAAGIPAGILESGAA